MAKLIKAILFSFGIVVFSALFLRVVMNHASAAELIDIDNGTDAGQAPFDENTHYQTFKPHVNNISAFKLTTWCSDTTSTSTIIWNLYNNTNDLVLGGTAIAKCTSTVNNPNPFITISPTTNQPVSVIPGQTYKMEFRSTIHNTKWIKNTSYADGQNDVGGSNDYKFSTWYYDNITQTQEQDVVIMDNWSDGLEHKVQFKPEYWCRATSSPEIHMTVSCPLAFSYTDEEIGGYVYLYQYNPTTKVMATTSVYSTTLVDNSYNKSVLVVPPYLYSTFLNPTYFCAQYTKDFSNIDTICGIKVNWIDDTIYALQRQLSGLDTYNIEDACSDVATSTGSYADDFRYGAECGLRKLTYWAFTPSVNSQVKILLLTDQAGTIFPMSVVRQVKDVLAYAEYHTATTSTSTLRVPLMVGTIGPSGALADTGADLFNDHMLRDVSPANFDLVTGWIVKIIYFCFFLYLVKRILEMSNHHKEDEVIDI